MVYGDEVRTCRFVIFAVFDGFDDRFGSDFYVFGWEGFDFFVFL